MLEKIKEYGVALAGAVMIGAGLLLGAPAIDEYIRTNDVYYPKGTAIVIENDQITDVYTEITTRRAPDAERLKENLFHIINGQNITIREYDDKIVSSGQVIEVTVGQSGPPLSPFSEGRANNLTYTRNGLETTVDISWEVNLQDPDEFMIRYGPSDYYSKLEEISNHISSNMKQYVSNILDQYDDQEYADMHQKQDILIRHIQNHLGQEITYDIYEKFDVIVYAYGSYDEFLVNEQNSGLAEGESIAYLTGEDYITELTDVADWIGLNIAIGTGLIFGGLAWIAVGLGIRPKRKNKEKRLFTDGEIIDLTKRQWAQDADDVVGQSDAALYAKAQLAKLEQS